MRDDILKQAQDIRTSIDNVSVLLSDGDAADNMMLYLPWEMGMAYSIGDRRRYGEKLYKCRQAHTSQAGWEPNLTPALWAIIDASASGTVTDPIVAERGMEYEYGKYYLDPEDNKTYLCKRGDETGTIVLHYLPHELIGNYFVEV